LAPKDVTETDPLLGDCAVLAIDVGLFLRELAPTFGSFKSGSSTLAWLC